MDTFRYETAFVILNLSSVFLLFFIYIKYLETKTNNLSNRIFITIIASLSIILCMSFPLHGPQGELYDLRFIPFFIGTIYGGRRVGLVLLAVILLFRLMFGFDGFVSALIQFSIFYFILFTVTPLYKKPAKVKQKMYVAAILSSFPFVLFLFHVIFNIHNLNPLYKGLITFIHLLPLLTVVIFVTFIENTRKENLLLSELKKIEKLKTVSDIAASISHEVRNPLTVIRGFLQLMKEADIPLDKRKLYVNLSLQEVDRAEHVIGDYLTFAKPSLENIEIIDLNREIDYVVNVVKPYAAMNSVEIIVKKGANVHVAGEQQKLHQCLINLAKNSIEAMTTGGNLTIELKKDNKYSVVIIGDTGVGMTNEQIELLGTPYYTTKGTKGTGLGTMVIYSIVKAMDGTVQVESKVGKGTQFKLNFPNLDI